MNPEHFHIVAGRDVADFLAMEKAQAADLCTMQMGQASRGYRGAELVRSMYGWSVRYDSGLQNWGIIASTRNGQINGSFAAAQDYARKWVALDHDRRYAWVRKSELKREGIALEPEPEPKPEPDCDVLADAIRGCCQNMVERMREDYHLANPYFADEAIAFIRAQLGDDAEAILEDAFAKGAER